MVMLYRLAEGPCVQSYGIQVARLAEFPRVVLVEAKRKAAVLEHHVDYQQEEEEDGDEDDGRQVKVQRMTQAIDSFMDLSIPTIINNSNDSNSEDKKRIGEQVKAMVTPLFPATF